MMSSSHTLLEGGQHRRASWIVDSERVVFGLEGRYCESGVRRTNRYNVFLSECGAIAEHLFVVADAVHAEALLHHVLS